MHIFSATLKGGLLTAYDHKRSLFIIHPGKHPRFFVQKAILFHQTADQRAVALYQTNNPKEARQLLAAVGQALESRTSARRLKLAGLLVGALILGTAISHGVSAQSGSAPRPETANEPVTPAQEAPAQAAVVTAPAVPPPVVNTAPEDAYRAVAQKLKAAAASGRYTVSLSSGHARTLYVFADPLCPHCREIEPVLEALGRDYNVEVFPVTLIGQQDTVNLVSPVLCAAPAERKKRWQQLFTGDAGMAPGDAVPTAACEAGTQAISRNDDAYHAWHLPGTPTLLADNGHQIPFSALKSDDALAAFMAQNGGAQ
ncbi:thioredoxin fold domain-containing protein [Enterobacter hormaechei]|nr:thioredoxin fold domain-containing protein [Enterobacter hormaechei]